MKVLDINGLSKLVKKVKDFVSSYVDSALPTKVSDLTNDSGFISDSDLQAHAENNTHLSPTDRERIDNLITNAYAQSTFATIAELNSHVNNSVIHVTQENKNTWNSKANGVHTHTMSDITDLAAELTDIRADITALEETGGIRDLTSEELAEYTWEDNE